ncbi:polysaccharide biosynthesis tyrosine autokinase [Blautia sp.]|uniref:polysaccharide biosynthesis tyrosine autokinase n=1 Tax=Blautia sp. TaxID=1955243 RepID=UPI003AB43E4C
MEQQKNPQGNTSIDVSFICRYLWKNIFVILMCACIGGILAYVGMDHFSGSTYIATMDMAMISRDNSASGNVDSAIARNLNVLNSEMLREQMKKQEEVSSLPGTVSASQVPNTNLITMSASAGSAENALRLLKSALTSYPTLTAYFESGYMLRNLTGLSVQNIEKQESKTILNALLAALLIMAAGVGLTVFYCISTDRIHNRKQASELLDMRMLGSLHFMKKKKDQKAILISDPGTDGVYVEEIDKLTTQVQSDMDKRGSRTLMVNSICENEGKSTVAVNLALNLARRGKKVMLIDADMRRPALAKIFDYTVDKNKSLSDLLQGKSSLQEVRYTDKKIPGFMCIFQKSAIAEPDKFLENRDFKALLKMISRHVDYVVIDTPPIGIVRDAEIVAGAVDAALLTIRQDRVRAVELNDVVDVLDDTGVAVIGGVLNMTKGERNSFGRRKRYGRYYYGYDNRKQGR